MRQPTRIPYCDVDHHPHPDTPGIATHIHKKQLQDHKTRIAELEAENRALKAQLGQQAWQRNTPEGDLLIGLAEAFDIAHTFADPAPQAGQTDTEGGRSKPGSREPKGGNRNARNALRDLIRSCESALQAFHNRRIHHDFRRPPIDFGKGPNPRCWTRGCPHYSRTITEDECPGCGAIVARGESQADLRIAGNGSTARP